jgi:hypothetical protein
VVSVHDNGSFENIKSEDVKQMMYGRPIEGRYTVKRKNRVERDTRGVLTGW